MSVETCHLEVKTGEGQTDWALLCGADLASERTVMLKEVDCGMCLTIAQDVETKMERYRAGDEHEGLDH